MFSSLVAVGCFGSRSLGLPLLPIIGTKAPNWQWRECRRGGSLQSKCVRKTGGNLQCVHSDNKKEKWRKMSRDSGQDGREGCFDLVNSGLLTKTFGQKVGKYWLASVSAWRTFIWSLSHCLSIYFSLVFRHGKKNRGVAVGEQTSERHVLTSEHSLFDKGGCEAVNKNETAVVASGSVQCFNVAAYKEINAEYWHLYNGIEKHANTHKVSLGPCHAHSLTRLQTRAHTHAHTRHPKSLRRSLDSVSVVFSAGSWCIKQSRLLFVSGHIFIGKINKQKINANDEESDLGQNVAGNQAFWLADTRPSH